jgi:hypothetical protein
MTLLPQSSLSKLAVETTPKGSRVRFHLLIKQIDYENKDEDDWGAGAPLAPQTLEKLGVFLFEFVKKQLSDRVES